MRISTDTAIAIKKLNEFLAERKKNECFVFQSWSHEFCENQEYYGPFLIEKVVLGVIEKKGIFGSTDDLIREPELIVRDIGIHRGAFKTLRDELRTDPFNLLRIEKGKKTSQCTLKGWQTVFIPASAEPIIVEGRLNPDIIFLSADETLKRVKAFQKRVQEIERRKQEQIEEEKQYHERKKQDEIQREETSKEIDEIFQDLDKKGSIVK